MKLQSQVSSLELSKKLEELGVKQESLWYWRAGRKNEFSDYTNKFNPILYYRPFEEHKKEIKTSMKEGWIWISAFTVSELGDMLPDCSYTEKRGKWYAKSIRAGLMVKPIRTDTEANARAKMLIYLIENKLVDV